MNKSPEASSAAPTLRAYIKAHSWDWIETTKQLRGWNPHSDLIPLSEIADSLEALAPPAAEVVCPACLGTGRLSALQNALAEAGGQKCLKCQGSGRIFVPPAAERTALARIQERLLDQDHFSEVCDKGKLVYHKEFVDRIIKEEIDAASASEGTK